MAIDDTIDELKNGLNELINTIKELSKENEAAFTVDKKVLQAKNNLSKAFAAEGTAVAKSAEEIDKLKKEYKASLVDQEKFNKILKEIAESANRDTSNLGKLTSALNMCKNATLKGVAAFTSFISVIGLSSITLKGAIESGMKYSQSLFDVSRMQRAVGGSSKDIIGSIEKLAKTTNLSRRQFVEFASAVQTGFLGIRPSMKEVAELSNILKTQVGGSFEAQKEAMSGLVSVQKQFPDLYDKMIAGLKLVDKINRGQGTEADEKRLQTTRDQIQAQELLYGIDAQTQAQHLALLGPVTEAEKELSAILQEKQNVTKSLEDAQMKFFDSIREPLTWLTKTTARIVGWMVEHKNTVLALGAAYAVLKTTVVVWKLIESGMMAAKIQQLALNAAAWANPYVLIAAAIAAAIVGIGYAIDSNRKAEEKKNEEIRKTNELQKLSAANEKDLAKLSDENKKKYSQQVEEQIASEKIDRNTIEGKEKIVEIQRNILSGLTKQQIEESSILSVLNRTIANSEAQLKIIDKISSGYSAQIAMAKEFGDVNEKAMEGLIKQMELSIPIAAKVSQDAVLAAEDQFNKADFGIKITIDKGASLEQQIAELEKALAKVSSGKVLSTDKLEQVKAISDSIALALSKQADVINRQNELIKKRTDGALQETTAMEKLGSQMEARLGTERKLMEVAQFGMGASVSMMQKQVELSYELMKGFEAGNRELEKKLMLERGISKSDVERIKSAKSINEVQRIANELGGSDATKRSEILNYWSKQQELTKKSMEQQVKIYELTKEVREGYLDAIREMSTGAGEFEKIIGTQEVGVTQLMKYVDQFSEGALNSIKLGGMQSTATTKGGVGTDITGVYTAGGPMSFNMGNQNKMNERLYGWKDSMNRYKEMRKGEGKAAEVGLSAGAGEDNKFIRPIQEEIEVQKKGNEEVVMELKKINQGVRSDYGSDYSLRGVNTALYNGSGRVGTNETYSGIGFPMSVARAAMGGSRAGGTGSATTTAGEVSGTGGIRGRTGYRSMTDEELSKKYFEIEKSRGNNIESQAGRDMREEMEFRSGSPLDSDVKAKTDREAADAAKKKLEDLKKQASEHTDRAIRASKIFNVVSSDNLSKKYGYKTTSEQASKKMEEEMANRRSLTPEIKKAEADLQIKEVIAAGSKMTAEETRARLSAPELLKDNRLSPEEQQQIAQQAEMKSMVSDFAQVADRVVPLKGETEETTRRKREAEITRQFSQVDFSKMDPAQLKKIEEARDKASAMSRSVKGPSAAAVQAAALEGKQPAGSTSRAASLGMESSGQAQAEYMSGEAMAKREMMYGSAGETAAGGIGAISGRIVVELSDDLKGEIKEAVGIALSLQGAVSGKGQ
jgi:hypothetical protein